MEETLFLRELSEKQPFLSLFLVMRHGTHIWGIELLPLLYDSGGKTAWRQSWHIIEKRVDRRTEKWESDAAVSCWSKPCLKALFVVWTNMFFLLFLPHGVFCFCNQKHLKWYISNAAKGMRRERTPDNWVPGWEFTVPYICGVGFPTATAALRRPSPKGYTSCFFTLFIGL